MTITMKHTGFGGLFARPTHPAPAEALTPGIDVIVTYQFQDPIRATVVDPPDRSGWVMVSQPYPEPDSDTSIEYLAAAEMIVLPEEEDR